MTDLFENTDDEVNLDTDELEVEQDDFQLSPSEARRRLELLLEDKQLRDELDDFFDE